MYYYDAAHVLDAWEGSGLLCQDNAATNSLVALEQYADRALSQDHFLLKRKITSPQFPELQVAPGIHPANVTYL